MHTFTCTYLANDNVLVTGMANSVSFETILDGSLMAKIRTEEKISAAEVSYDKAVKDFFAPLTEATEALHASLPEIDPAFIHVVDEGQEGVEAKAALVIELDHDTAVLKMLEAGDASRLRWSNAGGVDQILILKAQDTEPTAAEEAMRALFDL